MPEKITKTTPSFDPRDPHWDQIYNFPDGRFWEFGTRSLNRYDIRLTHFIASHIPRNSVTIVGRSLSPNQNHSDFLSIRVGANVTKLVTLSTERTVFITINKEGKISLKYEKKDFEEFRKDLPHWTFQLSESEKIVVENGGLKLHKLAEKSPG